MNRRMFLAVAVMGVLAGCSHSYYAVIDPTSGRTYYTTRVWDHSGGAVTLKDDRTGDRVTLQNSLVRAIPEPEYREGLTMRPEVIPAGAVIIPPPPQDHDRDDSELQTQP
jgi:hypothetical protein